jgi:transcriptional regulator with XRE-family HTH domain
MELERRKRHWTQAELGQQILYTTTHVAQIEKGKVPIERINRRFRHAVESTLGLPLEALLETVE